MYQYISRGSFLALLFSGIYKVVCIARSRVFGFSRGVNKLTTRLTSEE